MRARGQAMVESLVAVLVLTPLLFAIVQLATLQRAEQATLGAARAAALAAHHGLDGSVGPLSPAQLRTVFASEEGATIEVATTTVPPPSAARQTEEISLALLAPALAVGVGELDMPRAHAVRADASIRAAQTSGPFSWDSSPDGVSAGLTVMRDDWEADGASGVWQRTAALSTTGRIAAWRAPLSAIAAPARLLEPAVARLCLGRIEPDIVPEDRLRAPVRIPDMRVQPC